jgi:hypothetical protein
VSRGELAQLSGVSIGAIARIERYAADRPLPCKVRTWTLLVGALESAGVAFIEENGGGPACGCASATPPELKSAGAAAGVLRRTPRFRGGC